jgi:hypothetical protein
VLDLTPRGEPSESHTFTFPGPGAYEIACTALNTNDKFRPDYWNDPAFAICRYVLLDASAIRERHVLQRSDFDDESLGLLAAKSAPPVPVSSQSTAPSARRNANIAASPRAPGG